MPSLRYDPAASAGSGGAPSGPAGGDLTGTYPDPTLNAPTAAQTLGLGKYVAVGYNNAPTWIDPAAADWADVVANNYGWVQFQYNAGAKVGVMFVGSGLSYFQMQASTGSALSLYLTNGSQEYVQASVSAGKATLYVGGGVAQTSPLLELDDSNGNPILMVAPDGSVGGVPPNDGDQLTWDAGSGTIKWKGPLV